MPKLFQALRLPLHLNQMRSRPGERVIGGPAVGSGLPTPRRRTFATGIHALRSLGGGCALALRAALATYAGSRGMGNPSRHAR